MRKEILAVLASAVVRKTYDESVWFEFSFKGENYQIFDVWNFGYDMPEDHKERFCLSRIVGDPAEDDSYHSVGCYPSAKAAAEALLQVE